MIFRPSVFRPGEDGHIPVIGRPPIRIPGAVRGHLRKRELPGQGRGPLHRQLGMEQSHPGIFRRDPRAAGVPAARRDHAEAQAQPAGLPDRVADRLQRFLAQKRRAGRDRLVRVPEGANIPDIRPAHPLVLHLFELIRQAVQADRAVQPGPERPRPDGHGRVQEVPLDGAFLPLPGGRHRTLRQHGNHDRQPRDLRMSFHGHRENPQSTSDRLTGAPAWRPSRGTPSGAARIPHAGSKPLIQRSSPSRIRSAPVRLDIPSRTLPPPSP